MAPGLPPVCVVSVTGSTGGVGKVLFMPSLFAVVQVFIVAQTPPLLWPFILRVCILPSPPRAIR